MVLLLAICIYVRYFRKKKRVEATLPAKDSKTPSTKDGICTFFIFKFLTSPLPSKYDDTLV